MNPDRAVSISDVEKRMTDWKSTLRYLSEGGEPVLEAELMITIMISMIPDDLQDHLIRKNSEFQDERGEG